MISSHLSYIKKIKKILNPIFKRTGVERAILFGSYAKNTNDRRSDIDIFIIKKTRKKFFNRFEDFKEIYEIFEDKVVDLIIYTPTELRRYGDRDFVKRILKEGIVIYEC